MHHLPSYPNARPVQLPRPFQSHLPLFFAHLHSHSHSPLLVACSFPPSSPLLPVNQSSIHQHELGVALRPIVTFPPIFEISFFASFFRAHFSVATPPKSSLAERSKGHPISIRHTGQSKQTQRHPLAPRHSGQHRRIQARGTFRQGEWKEGAFVRAVRSE